MRYLSALLLFFLATLSGPGALSAPQAAQRLPPVAKPEHYQLWFEPNLITDTFAGRTKIRVQLSAATSEVQ